MQTFHPQMFQNRRWFSSPNPQKKGYFLLFWVTAAAVSITANGDLTPKWLVDMSIQKRSVALVHLFGNIKTTYKAALTNSALLPDSVGIFHIEKRNSVNPLDMRNLSTLPKTQKLLPVKIIKNKNLFDCITAVLPAGDRNKLIQQKDLNWSYKNRRKQQHRHTHKWFKEINQVWKAQCNAKFYTLKKEQKGLVHFYLCTNADNTEKKITTGHFSSACFFYGLCYKVTQLQIGVKTKCIVWSR